MPRILPQTSRARKVLPGAQAAGRGTALPAKTRAESTLWSARGPNRRPAARSPLDPSTSASRRRPGWAPTAVDSRHKRDPARVLSVMGGEPAMGYARWMDDRAAFDAFLKSSVARHLTARGFR